MALSNSEDQAAYKARMYSRGYKQKQVWIKPDETKSLMTFDSFTKQLAKLMEKLKKDKLSKVLRLLLSIAKSMTEIKKSNK